MSGDETRSAEEHEQEALGCLRDIAHAARDTARVPSARKATEHLLLAYCVREGLEELPQQPTLRPLVDKVFAKPKPPSRQRRMPSPQRRKALEKFMEHANAETHAQVRESDAEWHWRAGRAHFVSILQWYFVDYRGLTPESLPAEVRPYLSEGEQPKQHERPAPSPLGRFGAAVAVGVAVTLGLAWVLAPGDGAETASDWSGVVATEVPPLGLLPSVLAAHPNAQGLSAPAVSAPSAPFDIERRAVRVSDIQAWRGGLQGTIDPSSAARGVPFDAATAYCASLRARLPTEEEWEAAGRLGRIVTEAGLQEWTSSPYRPNDGGPIPAWASTFVAIRGVPADPGFDRSSAAPDSWAYREPMCAHGECPSDAAARLDQIGFRCARSGVER